MKNDSITTTQDNQTLRLLIAAWVHGLTDVAIAEVAGVNRMTVYRWRHGKGEMTASQWARVAHHFKLGRMTCAPHKRAVQIKLGKAD